jgi:hypothetical protein
MEWVSQKSRKSKDHVQGRRMPVGRVFADMFVKPSSLVSDMRTERDERIERVRKEKRPTPGR